VTAVALVGTILAVAYRARPRRLTITFVVCALLVGLGVVILAIHGGAEYVKTITLAPGDELCGRTATQTADFAFVYPVWGASIAGLLVAAWRSRP
jgi:hypothetical protein